MSLTRTSILAVCVLAGSASSALAEEAVAARALKVGADLAVVVPSGDWSDTSGIGFGLMARIAYTLNPHLSVTLRPGYVYHLSKSVAGTDVSTTELLLVGGAQYNVSSSIFIGANTGVNLWTFKASQGGVSTSDSNTRIPMLLEAGFSMVNGVTAAAGLIIPNLLLTKSGENMQTGVIVSVGYTFMR